MAKGGATQTQTTSLDPSTQAYVDQMRQQATQGANVALQGPGSNWGRGGGNFGMGMGLNYNPQAQQAQQPPPRQQGQSLHDWMQQTSQFQANGGGQQPMAPQGSTIQGVMGRMQQAGGPGQGESFFTGPHTQTPGEMAEAFMNPYQEQVIGGIRGEFDHLRDQALMGTNQQATQAGAFGGSRAAVMAGARMGELDRAQTSQIGNFLHGGYQNAMNQGVGFAEMQRQLQQQQQMEPLWRQQQAMNMMNLGMGPHGYSMSQQGGGSNAMGSAIGGATVGSAFGVPGAAIGGGLGLLGGLLNL